MKQKAKDATALFCINRNDSVSSSYDGQNLGFPVYFIDHKTFLKQASSYPIIYGRFDTSPFGPCWIGLWHHYIIALDFTSLPMNQRAHNKQYCWWSQAPRYNITIQDDPDLIAKAGNLIFFHITQQNKKTYSLLLVGTPFQHQVWQELCKLHKGQTISYKECAIYANKPKAARAVGGAVGSNPISWLVPCHRIIGSDNQLTGFGWGLPLKETMLSFENKECLNVSDSCSKFF